LFQDVDNNKAIGFYAEAAELATRLQRPVNEWRAYYNLGYSHLSMGKYEKAIEYYLQAIRIGEAQKFKGRLANSYMSLGNVFFEMGNLQKASQYHEMAAAAHLKNKDSAGLASYYLERGLVFSKKKQLDSAEFYFAKTIQLGEAIGDAQLLANAKANLGLNFKKRKQYPQALALFKEALYLGRQAYDVPDYVGALYNNLAVGYMINNMVDSARAAFHISLQLCKVAGSQSGEMENYRNLAELYKMTSQPDSQLHYTELYYALKDTVLNADIKASIAEKEAEYRIEKKQTEIETQRKTRNWLIGIATLALVAAGSIAYLWRQTQRNNQQLLLLNQRITQQKDQLEKLNGLKDRLMSIISHDLRNPLATIQTFFDISTDSSLPPEQLRPLQQHTSQVVQQTSQMLDNMLLWARLQVRQEQPPLAPVTLQPVVQEVVAQVQPQADKKQVQIATNLPAAPIAVQGHDEMLRIVCRNLLTNAVKFSQPGSRILLSVSDSNGMARIAVQDQGIGMSPEQVNSLMQQTNGTVAGTQQEKGSGLGVFLVHELLRPMQGKLEIESVQGQGSVFSIVLPALQQA
jgi:signal transduction histidine kinase